MTLGFLHGKLTEKLSKIQMLDEQIIEAMSENEDFEQEALTQDEKTVEIEQAIGNLVAMLRGDEHEGVDDMKSDQNVQGFVKLPKLEIRWFSGDALEFPTFQQQF